MKRQKKILIPMVIFIVILLSCCKVFAEDEEITVEVSEEYKKYLELSDEEKEKIMAPRIYEIPKTTRTVTNPLKIAKLLGATVDTKYSLRDVIPDNMVVRNQMQTSSSWAFATIGMLESTLALKDYNSGKSPVLYDFSERHIEYATSYIFKDGININGYNRKVGSGGNHLLSIPYLTNGTGAILEKDMPFEDNEDTIELSKIQNKNVKTQVNNTISFPSYKKGEDTTQIKQQIKEHIKNYGGIYAAFHEASISDTVCYNNKTGAIYCDDSTLYPSNHYALIVGWDDDYSKDNFLETKRPQNNGAWIIKNSRGTETTRIPLETMKENMFRNKTDECIEKGWTSAELIPDDTVKEYYKERGYTIENNEAYRKVADNGFMYISYEDANIYRTLIGITDAQTGLTYDNLYQYDFYGSMAPIIHKNSNKVYLATVFDKKTKGTEYLTQISISAPEKYTCKVYVNPNGSEKTKNDLEQVQLKTGESETFEAGYHTIEFLNPIQITGDSYVVMLEIQGTQENQVKVSAEYNFSDFYGSSAQETDKRHAWDNVSVESGKCFLANEDNSSFGEWKDTSKMKEITNGSAPNFDTTIKAFTKSTIDEKTLDSIEIATQPTKISYIEGEDFDKTGMIVKAKYSDGTSKEITDYTIKNGTKLKKGQASVTLEYQGKTVTQEINVKENVIEGIEITTPPTKTIYEVGEEFDKTGMIVKAKYSDGTSKEITDYTIKDGSNLIEGQTSVTIEYQGKTVKQNITVKTNSTVEKTVKSINIKTMPLKTEYIHNKEELDLTGGVIEVIYSDESKNDISMTSNDITASGFDNSIVGKTTITITYKEKTAKFEVEIKEEDNENVKKPQNSNFDTMQGNVTRMKAYYFTDATKKEYTIISVDVNNITFASGNDKMEYYYYLSSNPQENNIKDWVKIDNFNKNNNKLSFEINTSDNSNYDEISNSDTLYLYIKEVATLNNAQQEKITSSLKLEVENINVEEYVDGKKKSEVDSGTIVNPTPANKPNDASSDIIDDTTASEIIPKAGKGMLIIGIILILIVIGRITYLKYKDIQIK